MSRDKLPYGVKDDAAKPRYDLLPFRATEEIVHVLTFGARKYDDDNWRLVQDWRRRYFAAAMRHLSAWKQGERFDRESGREHLAHAMCCLLFLSEMEHAEDGESKEAA